MNNCVSRSHRLPNKNSSPRFKTYHYKLIKELIKHLQNNIALDCLSKLDGKTFLLKAPCTSNVTQEN